MSRPKFAPTAEQQPTWAALARYRARRARMLEKLDEEAGQLAIEADRQGIPIERIAEQIKLDRRTVYRMVGRPVARKAAS